MAAGTPITGIDCNGPAAAGVEKTLVTRFEDMFALRATALKWADPEGVHSMRVASRRLRSALKGFMPYVNRRRLASSLQQIRSIADALGQVRDQDVAILALKELSPQVPAQVSSTLRDIIATRTNKLLISRRQLRQAIAATRMRSLRIEFETAIPLATHTKRLELSYKDMARAIILERLVEVERLCLSLYRPLEAEKHHDARIGAKELRYAIEMFEDCWDSNTVAFAKYAARLQTALGSLHDCDEWIAGLSKNLGEATRLGDNEKFESYSWLFTHFNDLRHRHFNEAFSLWSEWKSKGMSEALTTTLSQ